jgi:hypothetical protein
MKNPDSQSLPLFGKQVDFNSQTDEPTSSFAKNYEQRSSPCGFDPKSLQDRLYRRGYIMIIKTKTKRITLLRFMLAKLWHSEDGISIEEFLLIHELYYDLVEITECCFLEKNKNLLETTAKLLVLISNNRSFPLINKNIEKEPPTGIPSKREYFGLVGQRDLKKSYRLVFRDTIVPPRLPPDRYIGVGYKDKGSRRNPAKDGSGSWQEIGTHFANLEREADEAESLISVSNPGG